MQFLIGSEIVPKKTFYNLTQDKRAHIEMMALEEFENKIYEKVSISRIVKNAEIAKGSFYQYFENKLDLASHLIELIAKAEMTYIEKNMLKESDDENFFSWLRRQMEMSIEFALTNKQYVNVYRMLTLSNDFTLQSKLMEITSIIGVDFYIKKIEACIAKGDLRKDISPDFLAQYLMTVVYSVLDMFLKEVDEEASPSFEDLLKNINQMIDIIENGIKSRRS